MSIVSKLLKALLPLVLFSMLAFFLVKGLKRNPHHVPSAFIGKPVPQFSKNALQVSNHPITNKIFQGHVSLLNVFASWCVYCRAEDPVLMDLKRAHQVFVYGLDYKDKRLSAMQWLENYGDPYDKIIFDPKGALAFNLGVYGTPETFIVDKHGVIRYKYVGPITSKKWKTTLQPIIAELNHES